MKEYIFIGDFETIRAAKRHFETKMTQAAKSNPTQFFNIAVAKANLMKRLCIKNEVHYK